MAERLQELADGTATIQRFVPGLEQAETTLRLCSAKASPPSLHARLRPGRSTSVEFDI
ncbi:hypothetical protein [Cupriavidus necator]|uniref:hypothetical protein n=1 Tax=Cupriavidus necator TaxID=106590 RepID=UPI000A8BB2C3|nr:hypothetical protein [Cupriavidus necator]